MRSTPRLSRLARALGRTARWSALWAACALPHAAAAQAPTAPQDPAALASAVEAFLYDQLAAFPGKASVTLDPVRAEHLAACDDPAPYLSSPLRLRSRISVGVRCTAPHAWTTYVQANVSVAGQYYVAKRPIPAGRLITDEDVAPRDADLATLSRDVVVQRGRVVGMRADARISAGQPIKGSALRSAQSVERGQNVTIVAVGKGFVVTSEGEVLADAGPGDRVQVRTASGQIVNAVVESANRVKISL